MTKIYMISIKRRSWKLEISGSGIWVPTMVSRLQRSPRPSTRQRQRSPSPSQQQRQTRSTRINPTMTMEMTTVSSHMITTIQSNHIFIYHLEYDDDKESYEYILIEISEAKRHIIKFSLPRGVNLKVDNLITIGFPDFLFDLLLISYPVLYYLQ